MTRVGEVGAYCSLFCALRDGDRKEKPSARAIQFLCSLEFRRTVRRAVRMAVRDVGQHGGRR